MRRLLFIFTALFPATALAAPAIVVAATNVPLSVLESTHAALIAEGIKLMPLRESTAHVVGTVELGGCSEPELGNPVVSGCTTMLQETTLASRFFMLRLTGDIYELHDLDAATGKADTATVRTRDDTTSLAASLVVQLLRPADYLGEMLVLGHPLTACSVDVGELGKRDLAAAESFTLTVPPGTYELQYVCADDAFPVSIEVEFGAPTTVDAAQTRNASATDGVAPDVPSSAAPEPAMTTYALLGIGGAVAVAGLFVLGSGFVLNALANLAWQFKANQQPAVDFMHTGSFVGMAAGLAFALVGAGVATAGGVLMGLE